jgi:hypothetical protein
LQFSWGDRQQGMTTSPARLTWPCLSIFQAENAWKMLPGIYCHDALSANDVTTILFDPETVNDDQTPQPLPSAPPPLPPAAPAPRGLGSVPVSGPLRKFAV